MTPEESIVSGINKEMRAHGYAMISAASDPYRDGVVLRFAVAGDDVLADRLRPIVIEVSGLDVMTVDDVKAFAKAKAQAAIDGATR